jgi:hypothetical protein
MSHMLKNHFLKAYLAFAIAAALIYCVPVYFFIRYADYTRSALLYVGNFLFMGVVGAFLFYFRSRGPILKMLAMISAGQKQVLRSIGCALIASFILLIVSKGLFASGPGEKYMINEPANTIHDKTNGLDFMVLVNSVVGNFFAGSFIVIILAASLSGKLKRKNRSTIL